MLQVGKEARISEGPFSGLIAKIVAIKPDSRVHLLLDIMGQATDLTGCTFDNYSKNIEKLLCGFLTFSWALFHFNNIGKSAKLKEFYLEKGSLPMVLVFLKFASIKLL